MRESQFLSDAVKPAGSHDAGGSQLLAGTVACGTADDLAVINGCLSGKVNGAPPTAGNGSLRSGRWTRSTSVLRRVRKRSGPDRRQSEAATAAQLTRGQQQLSGQPRPCGHRRTFCKCNAQREVQASRQRTVACRKQERAEARAVCKQRRGGTGPHSHWQIVGRWRPEDSGDMPLRVGEAMLMQ